MKLFPVFEVSDFAGLSIANLNAIEYELRQVEELLTPDYPYICNHLKRSVDKVDGVVRGCKKAEDCSQDVQFMLKLLDSKINSGNDSSLSYYFYANNSEHVQDTFPWNQFGVEIRKMMLHHIYSVIAEARYHVAGSDFYEAL